MKKKKAKIARKSILLLLAAAVLFSMQRSSVLAKTVKAVGEKREIPSNPVHNCTRQEVDLTVDNTTDTTDWSYIYFGSYPQTEVVWNELTPEIVNALYDANGDAWVNGTRYHRISKDEVNNTDYFGDSLYRYFKWERIKWRVLNVDSSTIFAMSDMALDCVDYHKESAPVTWETCTLRKWMNDDFYEMAFDDGEKEAIIEQEVVNENVPFNPAEAGKATNDNVFLLSFQEATNPAYGFCEDYRTKSASRWVQASDYGHIRGAFISRSTRKENNCRWWLRSPGHLWSDTTNNLTHCAVDVREDGMVYSNGDTVGDAYLITPYQACVPALHIALSSELWSAADVISGGDGGGESGAEKDPDSEKNPDTGKDPNPGKNPGTENKKPGISEKPTFITGKIQAKKKAFVVKWKKQKSVTGYQIQYSANKKFTRKATKTKTVKGASKTELTIKKLKAGKKYYVRVRTFRKAKGTQYYSKWSKAKTVKTKRK